ncbi:unnamed protein product [Linum trigynum]|uniref:Uncharacterized protein n=1 Tax=Linum trigynum TaxID=586398 RepID=A0AAV2EXB5_9ROSI
MEINQTTEAIHYQPITIDPPTYLHLPQSKINPIFTSHKTTKEAKSRFILSEETINQTHSPAACIITSHDLIHWHRCRSTVIPLHIINAIPF